MSFIFSKEQTEYLSRKYFGELQFFSRKPWKITLDPGHGVLWILGYCLLAIFEFELASPFYLGFKFSTADPGAKYCRNKISARTDNTWFSLGFGETTNECNTYFSEVAFLHQGGVAWALSREEEVMFLHTLPLDKMVLSPFNFCEGKGFSMVCLLQTELLALQECANSVVNHNRRLNLMKVYLYCETGIHNWRGPLLYCEKCFGHWEH